ncbi:glutamate--cysteine ligase [Bacteriovoracaceae bacterium]|nr:glutamate--cysteine ligase [Bacteriovoracaceae bacterium]
MNDFKINTKKELECFVGENWNILNDYLDKEQNKFPSLIYASVDIRESKHKFAPVDFNMYPAGFNNICQFDRLSSADHFTNYFKFEKHENVKTIGVWVESHTKNLFYLDHLNSLKYILEKSGHKVFFISHDENLFPAENHQIDLTSQSGDPISIHQLNIKNGIVSISEYEIDFIILNNDQSKEISIDWDNLSTPIAPSPKIGWFSRKKTTHFEFYHQVVENFCQEFSINPDLLEAKFKSVTNIDFIKKEGLEKLAQEVDSLKASFSQQDAPIYVKADSGTYGMGISVVNSGQEIMDMNRKKRNKMDVGKNNLKFNAVLIQEGIETVLKFDEAPAEVAIYMVNSVPTGGFLRTNSSRDSKGNLNARGMVYQKYCITEIKELADHKQKEAVYSIIARLSHLAGQMEASKLN